MSIVSPGTDSDSLLWCRFQRLITTIRSSVASAPEISNTTISVVLPAFGAAWANRSSAIALIPRPTRKTTTISTWWRTAVPASTTPMVNRRLADVLATVVIS